MNTGTLFLHHIQTEKKAASPLDTIFPLWLTLCITHLPSDCGVEVELWAKVPISSLTSVKNSRALDKGHFHLYEENIAKSTKVNNAGQLYPRDLSFQKGFTSLKSIKALRICFAHLFVSHATSIHKLMLWKQVLPPQPHMRLCSPWHRKQKIAC